MDIEEWKKYIAGRTGLPIDEYMKVIRCMWYAFRNFQRDWFRRILARWIREYNGMVRGSPFTYAEPEDIADDLLDNPFYFDGDYEIISEDWFDFLVTKMIEFGENIMIDNIELINKINARIRERKTYGLRTETVPPEDFCIIFWSNAYERWGIAKGWVEEIKDMGLFDVELDANMVLVPLSCEKVAMVLCFLEPLPLYVYSYEFKKRYVPTELFRKHSADWARRRLLSVLFDMIGGAGNV